MKIAAFTILHESAYSWFIKNFKNIHRSFSKWYVVPNSVKIYREMTGQSDDNVLAFKNKVVRDCYEISKHTGTSQIISNHRTCFAEDKLELCNLAYKNAIECEMDYLIQIDADEWYSTIAIDSVFGFIEQFKPVIANIPESKYWRNYHLLEGGIWNSWPPRIFKVIPGFEFGSHRPPFLTNGQTEIRMNVLEVTKLWDRWNLKQPLMDHFCYVDPYQVALKSEYFSILRKDHPTYSKYLDWYYEQYCLWNNRRNKVTRLHPACNNGTISSVPKIRGLGNTYPNSRDFLYCYFNGGLE